MSRNRPSERYSRREDRHDGPPVEVQLRLSLELLRAQREPFELAWPRALAGVQWLSARERKELLPVLEDPMVREAFGCAYEGVPDPRSEVCARLDGLWDTLAAAVGPDPAEIEAAVVAA